jgi:tetratricopeptide (TPR) repeat protein
VVDGVSEDETRDSQIGDRVRRVRLLRGAGQADLAAAAHVSPSYISLIEHGRRPATMPVLRSIGARLGISVQYLQTGEPTDGDRALLSRQEASSRAPEERRAAPEPNGLELDVKFAEMALRHGDVDLAEQRLRQILESFDESSDDQWILSARLAWGRTLEAKGSLEEAIRAYEALLTSVDTAASFGDTSYIRVIISLCRVYRECGDLGRAIELGELAISMLPAEASDNPEIGESEVALVSTLAGCYFERGDMTRAHLLADSALERAAEAGLPLARGAAYWNAALIAEARGESAAARRFVDRARAIYAESDNQRAVALLKLVAAWLILRDEKPELARAEELLESALTDLPVVGSQVDIAYGEIELARCRMLAGDWQDAVRLAEASIERLGDGPRLQGARARLTLGQAKLIGGDQNGALATFATAAKDLRAIGADRQAAEAWRELAEILIRLGRAEDAFEAYRAAADAAGLAVSKQQFAALDAARRRP